jgi:hypothetical protein
MRACTGYSNMLLTVLSIPKQRCTLEAVVKPMSTPLIVYECVEKGVEKDRADLNLVHY